MFLNRPCSKCGGQLELDFDNGWEGRCLQCGKVEEIDSRLVPAGLKPRNYSVISNQSALQAHIESKISGTTSLGLPFYVFHNSGREE